MKVEILDETTIYPLQKIGKRAGICWGADISNKEKNIKRALDCINSGHGRVLEYVNIELCISGISARVAREWYTHIGCLPTRLQESTRYVNESNFNYITPASIENNKEANDFYTHYLDLGKNIYKQLVDLGIPREDCAMLLPLAMDTKIVDKRNLRNLIDMAEVRLCNRAYWEYRQLMNEIIKQLSSLSEEWKIICDNYLLCKCDKLGYCTESKCCGKKPRIGENK